MLMIQFIKIKWYKEDRTLNGTKKTEPHKAPWCGGNTLDHACLKTYIAFLKMMIFVW